MIRPLLLPAASGLARETLQCARASDREVVGFLGGHVLVARGACIGMGAAVREHMSIGAGAVVGMSAAALPHLPPSETWVGTLARPLRATPSRRA